MSKTSPIPINTSSTSVSSDASSSWWHRKLNWPFLKKQRRRRRNPPAETYTYQVAEVNPQMKNRKRGSSTSSSENYSSSRSDSWKHNHQCGIPMR